MGEGRVVRDRRRFCGGKGGARGVWRMRDRTGTSCRRTGSLTGVGVRVYTPLVLVVFIGGKIIRSGTHDSNASCGYLYQSRAKRRFIHPARLQRQTRSFPRRKNLLKCRRAFVENKNLGRSCKCSSNLQSLSLATRGILANQPDRRRNWDTLVIS